MAKYLVRVMGKMPEQLEVEAANEWEAENDALNEAMAGIEFVVELIPEPPKLFLVPQEDKCQQESQTTISI